METKVDINEKRNLVTSELAVKIITCLNNFESQYEPDYKISESDKTHVLASIVSNRTSSNFVPIKKKK